MLNGRREKRPAWLPKRLQGRRRQLDQVKARNKQGMKVEENISAETAKQTEKPSMTGSKKKSALKKRHKTATKKKQHKPATPQ